MLRAIAPIGFGSGEMTNRNILIIYFSFGSTVKMLAEAIGANLQPFGSVKCACIEPKRHEGYWGWLLRSLVPGWRVPIQPTITDLRPYELVCLGFPKWTLSCPPLNQYLGEVEGSRAKKFALFMVAGGFDEARYMRSIAHKVSKIGGHVADTMHLRRRQVLSGEHKEAARLFCQRISRCLGNRALTGRG